jgi:hypothetical protein
MFEMNVCKVINKCTFAFRNVTHENQTFKVCVNEFVSNIVFNIIYIALKSNNLGTYCGSCYITKLSIDQSMMKIYSMIDHHPKWRSIQFVFIIPKAFLLTTRTCTPFVVKVTIEKIIGNTNGNVIPPQYQDFKDVLKTKNVDILNNINTSTMQLCNWILEEMQPPFKPIYNLFQMS